MGTSAFGVFGTAPEAVAEKPDLDSRIQRIEAFYRDEQSLLQRSRQCWVEIGTELNALKEELDTEAFREVINRLPFGLRQAQRYMRVSSHPEWIEVGMSLNEACERVTKKEAEAKNSREGWLSPEDATCMSQTTMRDLGPIERMELLYKHHEETRQPIYECYMCFGFQKEQDASSIKSVLNSKNEEAIEMVKSELVRPTSIVSALRTPEAFEKLRATYAYRKKRQSERPTPAQAVLDLIDGIRASIDGWEQTFPDGLSKLQPRAAEIVQHGSVARGKVITFLDRILAEAKTHVHDRQSD